MQNCEGAVGGMTISDEQLNEWKKIEKNMTPSPWKRVGIYFDDEDFPWLYVFYQFGFFCKSDTKKASKLDLEAIATLRNAFPLLLEAYAEQSAQIDKLKKQVKKLRGFIYEIPGSSDWLGLDEDEEEVVE